jgi:hypothetical protein
MPCVVCKGDTKRGFTYCDPCMKKDLDNKRLEQDLEKRFFNEDIPNNKDEPKKTRKRATPKNDSFKSIEKELTKPIEGLPEKLIKTDNNKSLLLSELKLITSKINNMEQMLKDNYTSIYVLVSRDMDQLVHIHGIYSTLDNANINYKKLITDADKYSKIIKLEKVILYKTYMDNLDGSFDTALFDDCSMEIILKKEYKINDTLIRN